MAVWRNNLIVGGGFRRAGNVEANLIAGWDGTNWFALGSGLGSGRPMELCLSPSNPSVAHHRVCIETSYPECLVPTKNDLCVFGSFTTAGGIGVHGAARWDGTRWRPFIEGPLSRVSAPVRALATDGKSVIAAGEFTAAGRVSARHLARWEGNEWKGFDGEIPGGSYKALAGMQGRVWIAAVHCGSNVYGLLEWDGTRLKAHCEFGLQSVITPIAATGGKLYVVDRGIKVFDGTTVLETIPLTDRADGIRALAADTNGTVYAGIMYPHRVGSGLVYAWDGAEWKPLGNGPEGLTVNALLPTHLGLFAGGEFTWSRTRTRRELGFASPGVQIGQPLSHQAAGIARLSNVGRWNGTEWLPLGNGIQGRGWETPVVYAMAYTNGVLYVGGRFSQAGDVPAFNIAAWNGQRWFALGSGIAAADSRPYATVYALVIHGEHLYVGGDFQFAGGKPAANFARWRLR